VASISLCPSVTLLRVLGDIATPLNILCGMRPRWKTFGHHHAMGAFVRCHQVGRGLPSPNCGSLRRKKMTGPSDRSFRNHHLGDQINSLSPRRRASPNDGLPNTLAPERCCGLQRASGRGEPGTVRPGTTHFHFGERHSDWRYTGTTVLFRRPAQRRVLQEKQEEWLQVRAWFSWQNLQQISAFEAACIAPLTEKWGRRCSSIIRELLNRLFRESAE
jgi:hypothetical protein